MYGTWTKLFVPDAKYRSSSRVDLTSSDSDISEIINIEPAGNYITGYSYPNDTILTPIPTDSELQSTFGKYSSTIQSAKICTDALIKSCGSSTSYAAGLARSCYISGLGCMDLPNFYEGAVIFCEADNIDNMDPTADDYPSLKIGYSCKTNDYYYYGRFAYSINMCCENGYVNGRGTLYFTSDGAISNTSKSNSGFKHRVVPVLEL